MRVKELIEKLQEFDPDFIVVGYCDRSEDDFFVHGCDLDMTDEYGLTGFYNQGSSVVTDIEPQPVVVIY